MRTRWHGTRTAGQSAPRRTHTRRICPRVDKGRHTEGNTKMPHSVPVAIKFTFYPWELRLTDIAGVSTAYSGRGVLKCKYSEEWVGKQLAALLGRVIIGGLFLLIISRSAECGEKPAACGPERLFYYCFFLNAGPSWYGGRATEPRWGSTQAATSLAAATRWPQPTTCGVTSEPSASSLPRPLGKKAFGGQNLGPTPLKSYLKHPPPDGTGDSAPYTAK